MIILMKINNNKPKQTNQIEFFAWELFYPSHFNLTTFHSRQCREREYAYNYQINKGDGPTVCVV